MKYKILGHGIAPLRATEGSAGFDFFLPEDFQKTAIFPGYPTIIDFQICVEIPFGWQGFLLPRSGLGVKQGLQLHNTVGLIDSDYRDSIKAVVSLKERGLDREPGERLILRAGDRIAQLTLLPCYTEPLELVAELSEPGTRQGGYGSTGIGQQDHAADTTKPEVSKLQIGKIPGEHGLKHLALGPKS